MGNPVKVGRGPLISFILCTICALVISFLAITPESYSISVGDIATENIYANREVQDEISTAEKRQQARDGVSPVFATDPAIAVEAERGLEEFFEAVNTVRQRGSDIVQEKQSNYDKNRENELRQINQQEPGEDAQPVTVIEPKKFTVEDLTSEDLEVLRSLLPSEVENVTDYEIQMMLYVSADELETARQAVVSSVNAVMKEGVRESDMETMMQQIIEQLQNDLATPEAYSIATMSVGTYLRVNTKQDEAATEDQRQKAEEAVVPVTYKKGQAIVREGDIIKEREIEVIRSLGQLAGGLNVPMYLGAFLCVITGAAACYLFARFFRNNLLHNSKQVLLCGIVMLLQLAVTALFIRIDVRLIPMMYVPLVLSICVDAVTASIFSLVSTSVSVYIMACSGIEPMGSFSYMLVGIIAGPTAAISVDKFNNRMGIMVAGIIAGLTSGVISVIMGLQAGAEYVEMIKNATYFVISGITSAIFSIGSTPIYESVFQVLTPMKLMELCNSTNHLLKKLALEAPGTYHHSTMVANLAEAAAEAIGANALLARAGGYYHDVGKLKAPAYYKENQTAENPHDYIAPEESARIIAMHTVDGGKMIRDARLPEAIAQIAEQHHGTYLMGYFYQMGLKRYGSVDETNYRHIGGLPTSREAAIVMLADSVEAAVRADSTDYMNTINSLIMSRLEDGQLNQAPLTLVDLFHIGAAFDGVLKGAYHNRIKYPKIEKQQPAKAIQGGNE